MPRPHPPGVPPASCGAGPPARDKSISEIAEDLGISDSCLRNWLAQADDEGRRDALSSRNREELVESRRQARTLKLENEILKRAAACFARENVRPK